MTDNPTEAPKPADDADKDTTVVPESATPASPEPLASASVASEPVPSATAAEGVPAAEAGAAFVRPEAAPKRRTAGVGLVAAVAIAALVGGAVGGIGVYALVGNDGGTPVAGSGTVGTNLMVNDVDTATVVTGVAASVAPSVVTLSVTGGTAAGTGSGVVLSEDGYILTNAHVATLEGATSEPTIKVQTYDGRLFDAKLVGSDPIADLAVVKIDSDVVFQPADFANSGKLNVGDTAIAIGAPLGLSNTVTSGVVSALNRSITVASSAVPDKAAEGDTTAPDGNGYDPFGPWRFDNGQGDSGSSAPVSSVISLPVIQTDAAINPGNSGGALLNDDGKVIGINVAIASTGSSSSSGAGNIGVGFAIPANYAKRVAFEIIDSGTATHGLLGATVADVTEVQELADSSVVGAAIDSVSSGGAAAAAGLKKGDVVTSFNGLPITGKTDLTAQVRVLAGGDKAEIVYVRGGKSYTESVTLGSL
ncbi:putative serine protease PepD [Homoserinimonas aerilata]|uniref:Putative serine protease PepD n=1 Tax=Homoserinimonas aerilata TaxID=1162970 RepID=A0A542YH78_9MICO|nr:trypsin-like peptidase domain-containing protein [Homoserinimonas aerilata]TQL47442.1 putative serine protease PepD [Homoserinimonas aerilata]